MNFASLLRNTNLSDMVGVYTGISLITLKSLYENYLKPIWDSKKWSESEFFNEINSLGVNNFIDKYFNFHCLEVFDIKNEDESFECVQFIAPNMSYIPKKLHADLNSRYKNVSFNKEEGLIECMGEL